MKFATDYCPHCCVVHVTCECPREDETEKQYWDRMERKRLDEQEVINEMRRGY